MKNLTRNEAVLLALLAELGREVVRTKLVKLTYLLDNDLVEKTGQQMTKFTYHWDYYGPNAVANEITNTLSGLAQKGLVLDTQRLTPYENVANYYKLNQKVDIEQIPLSPEDWQFVHSVVRKYGHLSRPRIVTESKNTAPMRAAKQFEVLTLSIRPEAKAAQQYFLADKDFVRLTREALTRKGDVLSLEQLKAEVG